MMSARSRNCVMGCDLLHCLLSFCSAALSLHHSLAASLTAPGNNIEYQPIHQILSNSRNISLYAHKTDLPGSLHHSLSALLHPQTLPHSPFLETSRSKLTRLTSERCLTRFESCLRVSQVRQRFRKLGALCFHFCVQTRNFSIRLKAPKYE